MFVQMLSSLGGPDFRDSGLSKRWPQCVQGLHRTPGLQDRCRAAQSAVALRPVWTAALAMRLRDYAGAGKRPPLPNWETLLESKRRSVNRMRKIEVLPGIGPIAFMCSADATRVYPFSTAVKRISCDRRPLGRSGRWEARRCGPRAAPSQEEFAGSLVLAKASGPRCGFWA